MEPDMNNQNQTMDSPASRNLPNQNLSSEQEPAEDYEMYSKKPPQKYNLSVILIVSFLILLTIGVVIFLLI